MQHDPAFEALVNEVRPHIQELTVDDVVAKLNRGEQFELIDVREDHEWQAKRIPHARHIGRGVLERDIGTQVPDKNSAIILYCGGGFRSALAAYNLQKMGYTQVASMDGGIREWAAKELPLES